MFAALDQQAETSDLEVRPPLVVAGPEGSGKSALLSNWVLHRKSHLQKQDFLFYHFVGFSPASMELEVMLCRLVTALKSSFNLREMMVPDTEEKLAWCLNRFFQAASKKEPNARITVVVDGINNLTTSRAPPGSLHWLPTSLPTNVRFIISTVSPSPDDDDNKRRKRKNDNDNNDRNSPSAKLNDANPDTDINLDEMVDTDAMSRASNDDLKDLQYKMYFELVRRGYPVILMESLNVHCRTSIVQKFVKSVQSTDPNFIIPESNQFQLCTSFAAVSPLYLRCFLTMYRLFMDIDQNNTNHEELFDLFLSCPTSSAVVDKALTLYYRVIWDYCTTLYENTNNGNVNATAGSNTNDNRTRSEVLMTILSLIYVSRDGLTDIEMWDLAYAVNRVHVEAPLKELIMIIVSNFTVNINGKYNFSHDIYSQVVYNKYIASKTSLLVWHQTMSDYFAKLPVCERKLICLPYHLEESGASQKVRNCLTDIDMFCLWWTPPFKKDFLKFWMYLLTGSSDNSTTGSDEIQKQVPVYDIVEEYVKSLDAYYAKYHPSEEQMATLALEIADFMLEFALDGYEERIDIPQTIHPVVPYKELKSLGVPALFVNDEGRTILECPSIFPQLSENLDADEDDPSAQKQMNTAGSKPVDDLPIRTTYYFTRWLWIQFPVIALGNVDTRFVQGLEDNEKKQSNYLKSGATMGSMSPTKNKSDSGFVFTMPDSPSVKVKSKNFKLPDIKFNRKAARSFSKKPKEETEDNSSNQVEQRLISLQDSIQSYREEYDFLHKQSLVMKAKVYELSGSLRTLEMVGESMGMYDDDFNNCINGEENARKQKAKALRTESNLKNIHKICTRHPAHSPALIYEVEQKIDQDTFLLSEIRKRLFEQHFELLSHKVAYKEYKDLAKESGKMRENLLQLRYVQRKQITLQGQQNAAIARGETLDTSNGTLNSSSDLKNSKGGKTGDSSSTKSPKRKKGEKPNLMIDSNNETSDSTDMSMRERSNSFRIAMSDGSEQELDIRVALNVILSRTGIQNFDLFFERFENATNLASDMARMEIYSEKRLKGLRTLRETVEKELEESRYESSLVGGSVKDIKKQDAITAAEKQVKKKSEYAELYEGLVDQSLNGMVHIAKILGLKLEKPSDFTNRSKISDIIRKLEGQVECLMDEMSTIESEEEKNNKSKHTSRANTPASPKSPKTPKSMSRSLPSPASHSEVSPFHHSHHLAHDVPERLLNAVANAASPTVTIPSRLSSRIIDDTTPSKLPSYLIMTDVGSPFPNSNNDDDDADEDVIFNKTQKQSKKIASNSAAKKAQLAAEREKKLKDALLGK